MAKAVSPEDCKRCWLRCLQSLKSGNCTAAVIDFLKFAGDIDPLVRPIALATLHTKEPKAVVRMISGFTFMPRDIQDYYTRAEDALRPAPGSDAVAAERQAAEELERMRRQLTEAVAANDFVSAAVLKRRIDANLSGQAVREVAEGGSSSPSPSRAAAGGR